MSKVDFNVLRRSELDIAIGRTVYSKYRNVMDKYIIREIKNNSFSLPIVQVLVGESPELRDELLDLYERKMAMSDTSDISEEIKILQASVFDGLVLGYDASKDMHMGIYTANTQAIFNLDNDSSFTIEKTLEMNRQGVVHSVRIDVEYTSEEGFNFKPVKLNKNTRLEIFNTDTMQGKFFLVPYLAIQRSMAFFKQMLDDGVTLKVTQEKSEITKVRNISAKAGVLAKYSDNPEFAKSLKPEYYPLKAYFYAPVLGASSLSLGKTRIDLVDISRVENISKSDKIEKVDSFGYFIHEKALDAAINELYNSNKEGYMDFVAKLPNKDKAFGVMGDCPSPSSVLAYYRQIGSSDKEKVSNLIPGLSKTEDSIKKLLTGYEIVDVDSLSVDGLKDMLKEGVYKVTIKKKDCMYSTMIVTNNPEILATIYGKDYFKNYESYGVRLYKLESLVGKGEDVVESMKYCGFDDKLSEADKVIDILNTTDPKLSHHERLANLLRGELNPGKVNRKASNENLILCRECFSSGSAYMKSLDINKIESIIRLG